MAGIILAKEPKLGDNPMNFCGCLVRLRNQEEFSRAVEEMRFFKIDGKQCRALPFYKNFDKR